MTPDDPGYEAWVAGRRDYIGASEVAAVLGISPWESPIDVWAVKLGHVPPKRSTLQMELGHWMEEFIARRWTPRPGEVLAATTKTVPLHGYPHIRATPDRLIKNTATDLFCGLVECKNVGWRLAHHWNGAPPIYVQAQCQVQMAVDAYSERVDVVACIDDEIRQYTVERDQATIDRIVEQVDAWWQRHIVGGEQPDPTVGPPDKVAAVLSKLHVPECVTPIEVSYDVEAAVFELGRLKALRNDLENDIEVQENIIRAAIGEHATDAMRPGSEKPIATWRPQNDTRVNTKRLRDEYPDVADAVTETTTRNVLRTYPQRCN